MEKYVADNENLMREWDFKKNATISPYQLAAHSTKTVWWKCSKCGYGWLASPNNRNKVKGTNCPACANKIIIKGKNDLQSQHPNIAKRWHPTLNKKRADEVFAHSNKTAYWTCPNDPRHYFQSRIAHMVDAQIDCPVCANQTVITGINDLATTNPELVKEWDFDKNTNISPYKITYGNQRKVWWKCHKGHGWQATVASRATTMHCGCPICQKELHVSFQEAIIAFYLSQNFQIIESKTFDWLKHKEIDIYLPELNLGIEYDGQRWHKKPERDFEKDLLCKSNGMQLIRIREPNCPQYESSCYFIMPNCKPLSQQFISNAINEICSFIKNKYCLEICVDVNLNRDYYKILNSHISLEKENSLANTDLVSEWNYNKNYPLLPSMFSKGSDKKVWWICKNGHEWPATISSRTGKQHCSCPYCAGQKCKTGFNDIQTLMPNVLSDWDYDKNSISPREICAQSNVPYWWKCHTCGHEWETSPAHIYGGRGCLICGRVKTANAHNKKVKNIETGDTFDSIKAAANAFNLNPGAISNCCRKISKTAGGYHWTFV